jgi:hypothetical protein
MAPIAKVFVRTNKPVITPMEAQANARLIAAVPDLLMALRGLLLSADASWETSGAGHDWHEACITARAAIAKAEGR